jgi:ABC-type Mn2+/Zn2+ transport system permease subunit/Mn-dependent DtxR family transcriptional regulator
MQELINTLGSEWALRALITCILVGITCGLIGCFIVLRNMSLIGDALSHAILPGIYVAYLIAGYSTLAFFIGSVTAGIITAITITWIQHKIKTKNDAAIGIVFTCMFSIGVMGISRLNNQQGNHLDLKDFLFGNVLGISNEDIVLSGMVMIYTILSIIIFYRYFFITTFQPIIGETMGISTKAVHYFMMLMLSFAVVSALRSVGVILVVAMLITPASTALLLSHKLKIILVLSGLIGALSAIVGLILSIVYDTTPGPAMVVISTLIFFLVSFFAYDKGLVPNWWRQHKQRIKIIQEDILKVLHKDPSTTPEQLAEATNVSLSQINQNIRKLKSQSLITLDNKLTLYGKQKADELVRAHRLWETYQVEDLGLDSSQIHDDAEHLEHHLTTEQLDEIDKKLGYPTSDPHGSPIPRKEEISSKALINAKLKSKVVISKDQPSPSIESELWELGILPYSALIIHKINEDNIEVKYNEVIINITSNLAKKIIVK